MEQFISLIAGMLPAVCKFRKTLCIGYIWVTCSKFSLQPCKLQILENKTEGWKKWKVTWVNFQRPASKEEAHMGNYIRKQTPITLPCHVKQCSQSMTFCMLAIADVAFDQYQMKMKAQRLQGCCQEGHMEMKVYLKKYYSGQFFLYMISWDT